ncbi:MAG: 2 protein [Dehalococcoidia bacterium]|nr:2 protein [Dehalococcoidia bacterium]
MTLHLLLVLAISVLAFGLRVFHLGEQSLWYDEAFSILLARGDLESVIQRTALDTMPPLARFVFPWSTP